MGGLTGAVLAVVRQGAAAIGLGALFASCALREAAVLFTGVPPWEPFAAVSELAMLCVAGGGLAALRALRRTTRERDRAEDLHWDSMEAVRVMSELAARPSMALANKLDTVLALGCERFGMEVGLAWRGEPDAEAGVGELIALRAPQDDANLRTALLADLLPRLRHASRSPRPQLFTAPEAKLPLLFGSQLVVQGDASGALAFAGDRDGTSRFSATDKDVVGLMAQWLAVELERRTRTVATEAPGAEPRPAQAQAPAPVAGAMPLVALAPRPTLRSLRSSRGRDLNLAVQRTERQLRRRVGADASLELRLDPELPPAAAGRLSLTTLVTSIVHAAARLAPTGRIRLETGRVSGVATRDGEAERSLTLSVSVAGEAVDADAMRRVFDEPDPSSPAGDEPLPLARIERLLQRDGGDLSVSIEPRRRAVLTAFLPPRARRGAEPRAARRRSGDAERRRTPSPHPSR